jgi:hypothetical protein
VRFKKFIKFCEKFEKVLNKFEFKSLVLFVFEKKEKKEGTSPSFRPSRPAGPSSPSRSGPPIHSSFSFSLSR